MEKSTGFAHGTVETLRDARAQSVAERVRRETPSRTSCPTGPLGTPRAASRPCSPPQPFSCPAARPGRVADEPELAGRALRSGARPRPCSKHGQDRDRRGRRVDRRLGTSATSAGTGYDIYAQRVSASGKLSCGRRRRRRDDRDRESGNFGSTLMFDVVRTVRRGFGRLRDSRNVATSYDPTRSTPTRRANRTRT